jgi:D-tyrosyl-tRNA(Tyr) deacylase
VRAVIQRVSSASVRWDKGEESIGPGYVILLGAAPEDTESDVQKLADKILKLRIFSDNQGKFNLDAKQVKAEFLVISQFTLFADARGQNRPSFLGAAKPDLGEQLYEAFAERLKATGLTVKKGSFGDHMAVSLVNDGPVTLVLSTDAWNPRVG